MVRADIFNETKNAVLHASPEWALTFWQRMKGFMFSTPGGRAIIFMFLPAKKETFHMWFVFGPIDCVALDGEGRVIALREQFRPWRSWNPGVSMSAFLELPAGTIAKSQTEMHDVVALPQPPL